MVYIEFFDRTSIENICACLAMAPDEVIFVGDKSSLMRSYIKNYQKVFERRGQDIKFSSRSVSRWNTEQVIGVLEDIIQTHKECVFGITGGDEIVTFALGILCERYAQKNADKESDIKIQVHRFSIHNNKIYDCDMDGETIECHSPMLTVEENIQIYGGEIIPWKVNADNKYKWDMTADFRQDIEAMWSICKESPGAWNKQIGVFGAIAEVGTSGNGGLTLTVAMSELQNYYAAKPWADYDSDQALINKLKRAGLITNFDDRNNRIVVTFKNTQVKKCLSQAGLALEMKIYKTMKELIDEEDEPLYNDVMNGVQIDWDGDIPTAEEGYDTVNEIDVLAMHHMIPVFVSCKNGKFTAEELYKLNSVAERFGGKYAKKVLVASRLEDEAPDEILKLRANDMKIQIIAGDDLTEDEKLKKRLTNVWR